jgi:general secretion pathway protein L
MTELLILRVPEHDEAPTAWLIADLAGAAAGTPQRGTLTLAAPIAANRRVIALVPGVDVLLAEPELPVKSGARLAQIVPFALEEQIAGDVDGMHFSVGKRDASRKGTPVAAVSRESFAAWLQRLRAAGIEPHAVHVDTALVPNVAGHVVLVVDDDRVHVRHSDHPPFVLNAEPLTEAFALAGLLDGEEQRNAIVYLTQENWQRYQSQIDGLRDRLASLKVQLLPDGVLPLFAQEVQSAAPIDLLQGPYARKTRAGEQWRQWRIAAFLLAGLVALNLAAKAIDIWRLGERERELDASIEQVFRETMGEQNAIDARRRMEARLAAVRGGGGDDNLLEVLGVLGSAVSQVPNTTIEAMSFRSNVLDMRIDARDVTSLDRVEQLVKEGGLDAELQSSNARGDTIEGRIQIRAPGAPANRTASASDARRGE